MVSKTSAQPAALIVFAKPPVAGQVKTRLVPHLSAEGAAALYRAFLHDTLRAYVQLDVAVRLYATPPAHRFPEALVPRGVTMHEQQGGELGERMLQAFEDSFRAGARRCVIIGTDHPSLPGSYIRGAFRALRAEASQLCIGPSDDGGYYLLGMNGLQPRLFAGMTYSHAEVYRLTMDRARKTGAEITELPPWYDVDTPRDLQRLVRSLGGSGTATTPKTREVLTELGLLE